MRRIRRSAFSGQRSAVSGQRSVIKVLLYAVLCTLYAVRFSFAASSSDEITGGFRFVSPGVGDEKRWKVEGDQAQFISEDLIQISPVRAVVYQGQEPDYLIEADWARLNRATRDVWTDSPVEITKGNSRMTGIGLRWEPAKKQATILSHVKMSLDMDEVKGWHQ